jgi:SAM-dependent methyltransferase
MAERRAPDESPHPDARRASTYYDRIAERYDDQVDGEALNRTTRDAFRPRVSELAGDGGTILDFGCGTGTDAAWYADRGHRVLAYDISAGMVDRLCSRFPEHVGRRRIIPIAGGLRDLEFALESRRVDVVASNFAVLNHFDDLDGPFRMLASALRPGGSLVASVLNPFQRDDVRRLWWWRGLVESLRTGAIPFRGEVTTYRHFVRTIRRMAHPYFAHVEVGHADDAGRWSSEPLRWRDAMRPQFVFLVLRKAA